MINQKGQIQLATMTMIGMLGAVFAWTFSNFGSVNDKISQQASVLSATSQKTNDIDDRLTRIEGKIDSLLEVKIAKQK